MCSQAVRGFREDKWARGLINVLRTEYPSSMHHVSESADDVSIVPSQLHPSFWGAFDWHSSVHMQCTAVRLLGNLSDEQTKTELVTLLDDRLTTDKLEAERHYLLAKPAYERPYGWVWVMQLAAECARSKQPEAKHWLLALTPLVKTVEELLMEWLPTMSAPIRHGVHDNTAFSMYLALEAGHILGLHDMNAAIRKYSRLWFENDVNYPVQWEFSGHDFLSAGLTEALLMRKVLDCNDFRDWFRRFFPDQPAVIGQYLRAPVVNDIHDGKQSHLFGLALTRAWMLLELSESFSGSLQGQIHSGIQGLKRFAEDQLVEADFMSTHWLITYALRVQLAEAEKVQV